MYNLYAYCNVLNHTHDKYITPFNECPQLDCSPLTSTPENTSWYLQIYLSIFNSRRTPNISFLSIL